MARGIADVRSEWELRMRLLKLLASAALHIGCDRVSIGLTERSLDG
jgi:hypothetical protein